ncbi:TonB-dependent receptor [Fulvivirgaceae bacterium PWU4]|uniref:TonB-dependent receptor n=1 Tax=Chryseosolibacter histidini TaxID=2782349 RepID=A0AAP2DLI3_9BACT|nr:TonB-dependent receptor [Chryseosolibacter histidini]MBT1698510.1 TonB-dependent receptor [Chryseosolibacter histidini]
MNPLRTSLGLGVILLLFSNATWAQQVSGKVSADDGEALPGVNVIVDGTSIGTTTDASGQYTLSVGSPNAVLVFSFIGYTTQRVAVDNKTVVNVTLLPDIQTLNEVVVVGYGTQKKVNLTAAVSTVSSEEIVSRQAPNTVSLLQGRTPGLQIVQNSGLPGAEDNQIRIRGQGTFSSAGSNPLVLIDGVEGKLELLNPNVIEDISVLKDAASAAIYGSRAANGVILVTTKKGKEGRLNIEYNYNYSLQDPSIKIDRVTNSVEYMELMNKAIDYSGRQTQWRYTDAQIEAYRQGSVTNPAQYPSADWTSYLIRKAPIHKHYLGINGGKGGTTFNVGLGVLDETGLLLATDYSRYDAQVNFKTNLGGRVTFGSNISMAKGKRHDSALTTGNTGPQLIDSNSSEDQMLSAYAAPPTSTPLLADGSGRFTAYAFQNKGGNKNPIAIATDGGGKEFVNNYILFTPYIDVKILEGLTAQVKGSVRFQEEMAKALVVSSVGYEFFPDANGVYNQGAIWNGGANSLAQRNTRENQYTLFGTLNYTKTIGSDHHITGLAGFQQESFRYDRLDAYRTKLPSKQLWELAAGPAASQTTGSDAYEWALRSFFGRANYDYKDRYLFEASFRYDASSRFPESNRWAFFPSLSGGWRLSEESFMTGISWIDELKLRGSWGQLGNQNIGNYPYQDILHISTAPDDEVLDYNFGGVLTQGISKRSLNNTNIRWETTTVTDLGLDFALFNAKLFGSVDWYKKTTKDILRSLQVPDHIGLEAPTINDGILENTGWEFILGYRNKIGDFSYSVNGNLETYRNKLIRFGAREISGVNIRQEGLPYNTYYVLLQDGIYQNQNEVTNGPTPAYTSILPQPGDLRFKDISGPDGVPDGVVDLTYDRAPVEGVFPKFNYGMNLSASYKGFDLSVFVQGVYGRKTYVTGWGVSPFNQASAPPSWWKTDAWDGEGTSNSVPHIYVDSGYTPNSQNSTFWLGNSSYLRLKNVQLGYTLPVAWSQKVKLQSLRVYTAADNLVTFTKFFQGLDPERTATNSARAAIYPQSTIYSFGVRATL